MTLKLSIDDGETDIYIIKVFQHLISMTCQATGDADGLVPRGGRRDSRLALLRRHRVAPLQAP